MNHQLPAEYRLALALERRAAEARQAALEARFRNPRPPFRAALGLSLVRLGQRLAEPSLRPARPR